MRRSLPVQHVQDNMTEAEKRFKQERSGGNYGIGTKEVQERNYVAVSALARPEAKLEEQCGRESPAQCAIHPWCKSAAVLRIETAWHHQSLLGQAGYNGPSSSLRQELLLTTSACFQLLACVSCL